MTLSPLTWKKLRRFKSIKRGYYAFVLFSALIVASLFAEVLVNSRALVV
ncbi:MAG: ABC transporter permease, partial [Deltaproteobacteria bacterium]|nr:ABC transporter permease [Deltaproteobacteria bacterium]